MDDNDHVLVKYCFSKPGYRIGHNKSEYYDSIMKELQSDGIIRDLVEYVIDDPFGGTYKSLYDMGPCDTYEYSFICNEARENGLVSFDFKIRFSCETYGACEILYVQICSGKSVLTSSNSISCLEILKHNLRRKMKLWSNRYCLLDEQSAYFAAELYPLIHKVENYFRYYVNDVFIKMFGANWWNESIASQIKEDHKQLIEDTRNYAGAYEDLQPHLLSFELSDLMKLAKTKKRKWVPSHDIRIENAINKYTNADIISLLREQCEITVDIWKVCFSKHLSDKFEDNYHLFEKRRNQIAHNKPIDYELYKSIKKLCENIYDELINGHTKFCSEFISDEEKERIDEYRYELEQQENLKYESLREIAEDESGTRVRNDGEIVELFDQTMYELYKSLIEIFNERQDIEFDEYHRIQNGLDEGKCFVVKSKIREMEISIMYDMDINCSQGETSCIDVVYSIGNINEISEIDYINGEYIYNYEQTNYMPEVQDRIVNQTVVEAKERICSFIEKEFPNLREEADLQNHLKAMGKSNSIVQSDVTCFACEEEYICINKKYAPVGTCLNCGEKNRIRYCTYCKCPVTAISIKEDDDEGLYCEKCHHELFTSDK